MHLKYLKKYIEVVLAAVQNHGLALLFASKELKEDKIFLIKCYKLNKTTIY